MKQYSFTGSFDFESDVSPLMVPVCALCTHDIFPDQAVTEFSNGSVAHKSEVSALLAEKFPRQRDWTLVS